MHVEGGFVGTIRLEAGKTICEGNSAWLHCTNRMRESSIEFEMVAAFDEQTNTYSFRNWSAYDEALRRSGSLTIWFAPEMNWDAATSGRPGRQQTYGVRPSKPA